MPRRPDEPFNAREIAENLNSRVSAVEAAGRRLYYALDEQGQADVNIELAKLNAPAVVQRAMERERRDEDHRRRAQAALGLSYWNQNTFDAITPGAADQMARDLCFGNTGESLRANEFYQRLADGPRREIQRRCADMTAAAGGNYTPEQMPQISRRRSVAPSVDIAVGELVGLNEAGQVVPNRMAAQPIGVITGFNRDGTAEIAMQGTSPRQVANAVTFDDLGRFSEDVYASLRPSVLGRPHPFPLNQPKKPKVELADLSPKGRKIVFIEGE